MDGMLPIMRKLISNNIKRNIPIIPNTVIHNILTDFFILTFELAFPDYSNLRALLPIYGVTAGQKY
jgi:hypothetical protein